METLSTACRITKNNKAYRIIDSDAPNYRYLLRDLTDEEARKYVVGDRLFVDGLACRVVDKNEEPKDSLWYCYETVRDGQRAYAKAADAGNFFVTDGHSVVRKLTKEENEKYKEGDHLIIDDKDVMVKNIKVNYVDFIV